MAKLDKSTVALTFKFDCDRFLRYRLATKAEIDSQAVPDGIVLRGKTRPGINLITAQGRSWEARCYDDVVDAATGRVAFKKGKLDPEIGRHKYGEVEDLKQQLSTCPPPQFVIEAQFQIPGSVGPGLERALRSGRLKAALGRPDILWIRAYDPEVPLVTPSPACEYIIYVVDVKLAAEPSLRHFVEVTFYALGLQAWLETEGLADRFGVCAAGLVWPGTHETAAFKSLVATLKAQEADDPLAAALLKTTKAVPYEVYKPRLQQFVDVRLPRVLQTAHDQAAWHVSKKCQLCEFFDHCQDEAKDKDLLSQLAGMTSGQVAAIQGAKIATVGQLRAALAGPTQPWKDAREESHALRAQERAIAAQAEALATQQLVPIPGRRTATMPKFAHLNIFLTAHFDPGTGITFAFGAAKVYFQGDGTPPEVEELQYPVDSIDAPGNIMSPNSEGARLAEICKKVRSWLEALDASNKLAPKDAQHVAHFYVWDAMEARQLARVVARHAADPSIMEQAEFLLRVFPPERELAHAQDSKSQPLTVLKPVVRSLFALPVPFEYTLRDAKNWLDPFVKDGKRIEPRHEWGFQTDLSDQIPLERAYEIWQDKPMLRKFHPTKPPAEWTPYTREEVRDGIKRAVKRHLSWMRDVVKVLGAQHRDRLLLRKEPFSLLKAPAKPRLPTNSVYLLNLERLSSVASELENRELLALPVEEREAQFHSIRGITPAAPSARVSALDASVRRDARYRERLANGRDVLRIFEFGLDSRDTRLREGAFTVVLRNEDREETLETKWYRAAGYETYAEAAAAGLQRNSSYEQHESLKYLLGATIARIDSIALPPLVAIIIEADKLRFSQQAVLRTLEEPMVVDPVHKDFSTDLIEKAIRRVGGKAN